MGSFRLVMLTSLALTLTLCLAAHAESALGLRMVANATTVKRGDTFQLDVVLTVNGQDAVDELELPDMSDFAVLRESESQQASFSMIGGRRAIVVEHRRTFILRATEVGTKQVGEATARLGGTTARAAPITIRVVGTPGKATTSTPATPDAATVDPAAASGAVADEAAVAATATDGPQPGARFGDALPRIFAELRVDKTSAFVGEQITVVGEVYSQVPLGQYPRVPGQKPAGFVCLAIDDGLRPQANQRILQGRSFYVYPVTRDAIFGLKPGTVELDPFEIEVSPSGSFFSRSQDVRVRSATVTVDVKPLPEPPPPDFRSDNVGRVELRAAVRPAAVKVGEPFTLVVEVVGWGNTEGFVLPQWVGDGGSRLFPPTTRRERRDRDGIIAGRIVEETLVQPAKAGRITIPPLVMVLFDPTEGRYVTQQTTPMTVVVGEGQAAVTAATPRRQTIANGARPLALGIEVRHTAAFALAPVVGGVVAVVGAAVGGLGRRRRSRNDSVAGKRDARRRDRATAAGKARASVDVAAAHRLLLDALAERFGDDVRAADTQTLATLLTERGLATATADGVVIAIVAADAARFAPGGAAKAQAVDALLQRLNDVDGAA